MGKKRLFTSVVSDGKIERVVSEKIRDYLPLFEGQKITIEIKKFVRTKTNPQCAYRYAVLYPHYLQAMLQLGDDTAVKYAERNRYTNVVDAVHEMCLEKFAGREVLDIDSGEIVYIPKRTSAMTTIESNLYDEEIRKDALENMDYEIPLPTKNE